MQLVETTAALIEAARELQAAPHLFLDTEFESSRQGSKLCLIQFTGGGEVYLVDPLRVRDLGPLEEALFRDDCEWVFHAGLQDVQLLLERFSVDTPPPVFDTQVAWALLSPEYSVSLAYLLYRALGVRTQKTHQADDWKRRPLPRAQLEYAAADVEHLPALREMLVTKARSLGREAALTAASRELLCPPLEAPQRLDLASFRNAWQLGAPSQAGLRYLIDWYNELDEAERHQAPEPKVLLSIANRMPQSAEELERIKGVPRHFARRQGDGLTGRLVRASVEAQADDFVPIDPPPYATYDEIQVDAWLGQVRATTCTQAQIAPELALPARLLKRIRRDVLASRTAEPAIHGLDGWRRDVLGDYLQAACERHPLEL